jgi:DNA-binding PadR family transcriptional regulator
LGREIILALVAEKPGTAWDLETRLRRRFRGYGYARNTVRRTLGRLCSSGLVVEQPQGRADAKGREGTIWEATPAGVERSREWLGEEVGGALARDELHARIAFCRPEDLPRLLEVVRKSEEGCEQRLAQLAPRASRNPDAGGLTVDIEMIASDAERAWWVHRAEYLRGVKALIRRVIDRSRSSWTDADV